MRCDGRCGWEEAKEEEGYKKSERNEVNGETPAAEGELCVRKWLTSQASEEDATDRDDVGRNQRGDSQRNNSIEGNSGAQVEEGNEDAKAERNPDGVERDK